MKRRERGKRYVRKRMGQRRRWRKLTCFFREKKDILLDLMDGMIGGVYGGGRGE